MATAVDDEEISGATEALLEDCDFEEMAEAFDEEDSPQDDIPQDELEEIFGNADVDILNVPDQSQPLLVRYSSKENNVFFLICCIRF